MTRPVVAALVPVLFAVLGTAPASAEPTCHIVEVTVPPYTVGTEVCPPV